MANLPALKTESSDGERMADAIYDQLDAGKRPDAIARKIYPNNREARRRLRRRIHRMAKNRDDFKGELALAQHAEMWLASPAITRGLIRRAQRGRVDAAKMIFEMIGLHNPKVKHEHSGDVAIKVTFDRPPAVETTATEIQDADVVEE